MERGLLAMIGQTSPRLRVELTQSIVVNDGVFVFVPAGSLGTVDDITEPHVVEVTFEFAILAGDGDGTRVAQYTIDVNPQHLRAVNR
jgi:hypothetical protein